MAHSATLDTRKELGHGVESLGGERVLSKVGVVGSQLKDGVFSISTVDTVETNCIHGEW